MSHMEPAPLIRMHPPEPDPPLCGCHKWMAHNYLMERARKLKMISGIQADPRKKTSKLLPYKTWVSGQYFVRLIVSRISTRSVKFNILKSNTTFISQSDLKNAETFYLHKCLSIITNETNTYTRHARTRFFKTGSMLLKVKENSSHLSSSAA